MFEQLERPVRPAPAWRAFLGDIGPGYLANGLIGFIFAASGPVAIILAVGSRGGLSQAELASWIFGVFFVNGGLTLLMSWRYQMPLGFAWTIPGTVLVGPALQHLHFTEVLGAFYATSLLILILAATGWVKRLMSALPMPIVMGMVAGVFLRFGVDLVRALHSDFAIAAPMVVSFLLLSSLPSLGRRLPPVIGALLVGALAVILFDRFDASHPIIWAFAQPTIQMPAWSPAALVELVLPLTITVLVVQNGQGCAVLRNAGHEAPVNTIAFASGIGAALSALVGAVSSCLTGPTNALLVSSGEQSRHYTAAVSFGVLALLFGMLAPMFTGLMLAAPREYIMMLGGLAMLRVLQGSYSAAFGAGRFSLGAMVCLLVTVADLPLFNIGAAFWGLVAGFTVSWLMEKPDFVALANGTR